MYAYHMLVALGYIREPGLFEVDDSAITWRGTCGGCGEPIAYVPSSICPLPKGAKWGGWNGYFHLTRKHEHFGPLGWTVHR